MNELDLIKESLQNELRNPKNYENLIHQSASNVANLLILKPVLDTLNRKIENLKENRKLRKNYKKILNSNLIELLKLLDDPNLNENNILLVEKLIILALSTETKPSDELLAKEYLKVAKSLNASEISLLQAAFERLSKNKLKDNLDIDDVYKDLAKLSGLKFIDLVTTNYESLVSKKLFKTPWNKEKTQISNSDSNYILTEWGLSFMNYLERYEKLEK